MARGPADRGVVTEGLSSTVTETREGAGDASASTSRRTQWIIVGVTLLAAVAVYSPILQGLVTNWYENQDYSHGFLIVPLSLYFIWERREQLARMRVEPSWWGILPLALASASRRKRSWRSSQSQNAKAKGASASMAAIA